MKWKNKALIIMVCACGQSALATEGGIGRPITGMQFVPLGGILPVEEGVITSFSSVYYDGKMERSRKSILGNRVTGGLDYNISYNLLNTLYVWSVSDRWTFASNIGIPVQYTKIRASVGGLFFQREVEDSSTNLADMTFSPIMVDYHFSQYNHILLNAQIYAPTGSYDESKLSNAGQNTWTLSPGVTWTMLGPESGIELTGVAALEFYTKNNATDYRNGTLFRLDALALQRFGNGWGAGIGGGWIQQIQNDSGRLADHLDGYRGRSTGVGPVISYETKLDNIQVSTSMKWIHEFNVNNRPEGDGGQINVTLQF